MPIFRQRLHAPARHPIAGAEAEVLMRRLALWLLPASLLAGQARFARLGEFDGRVEVQVEAAEPWRHAARNLPLPERAWLRTGPGARVEIELDEGSVLRLGPDSLAELSDYTRLSTGQRVTLISLDSGLAYFTGQAEGSDALLLALPGAQVTVRRGARLRLEAHQDSSQIAVLEGAARFSSPSAELDLHEGQLARVAAASSSRFYLYREIPPIETDRWSEERDQVLASSGSAAHVSGLRYGVADLDSHGSWISTTDFGTVWKPRVPEGWVPFRSGKWAWYEGLGFTWISAEVWGWLPYHYGRWMQQDPAGWFWVPGNAPVFKPGEVYWLRGTNLAGWGPLAPGEEWAPTSIPRLYLNVHTTFARLAADAREIDPAGFTARPREPLATARFAAAMPSPPLPAARLEAARPALRAGSTRVVPILQGVTYEAASGAEAQAAPAARQPEPAPADPGQPQIQPPVQVVTAPPEPPVVIVTPPPQEVYYPAPVYTGIVVVNPPERRKPPRRASAKPPAPASPQPQAVAPPSPQTPLGMPRGERVQERRPERTPDPHQAAPPPPPAETPAAEAAKSEPAQAQPAPEPAKAPIPRGRSEGARPERGRARQ
jgi:hypothetical protein